MAATSAKAPRKAEIFHLDAPVRLLSGSTLTGFNIYHSDTVYCQPVDLGVLGSQSTSAFGSEFAELYLSRFRSLRTFLAHNGLHDDFVARLRSASGSDVESLLLESVLCIEAAVACARHDLQAPTYAALQRQDQHTLLIWHTASPRLAAEIATAALLGCVELMPARYHARTTTDSGEFANALDALLEKARRGRLAPSTALLKRAASQRGIPAEAVGRQHLIIGQGSRQQHFYASMTSTTTAAAQKICADKRQTNRRLKELRLPVSHHVKVGDVASALAAAAKLGFPVVVKPIKGKKGQGVSHRLTRLQEVETAFAAAHVSGSDVLVEQFVDGDDFRLLVVGGRLVAAVKRLPPSITGDGKATVGQLIERLNQAPYRDGFRGFPVQVDSEVCAHLAQSDLELSSIVPEGQRVRLRLKANVSTGGTPHDVTDAVHPEVKALAERAARVVGLDVAGVDYLATDISRPPSETGGRIIELNARPGLDIHAWPFDGKTRDIGASVIAHCLPPDTDGRIPVITVCGDKGTGGVARVLDAMLRGTSLSSALSLRNGTWVNGRETPLLKKDRGQIARTLLRDPEIDVLVETVSLRETAAIGLGVDKCSVAVIMDRVKTGDASAFMAGLDVAAAAATDGIVVDAGNQAAIARIRRRNGSVPLILVGSRPNDPALIAHLDGGHLGITSAWRGDQSSALLYSGRDLIAAFPCPSGVADKARIASHRLTDLLLYAIAASYAAGTPVERIRDALESLPDIAPPSR